MSDAPKAPRTLAEVQAEYQGLCTRVGHTQYQIYGLTKELELFNQKLRDLNFEGAAIQQAAAEAPPVAREEGAQS